MGRGAGIKRPWGMDGAKPVNKVRLSSLTCVSADIAHPLFYALLDDLYRY